MLGCRCELAVWRGRGGGDRVPAGRRQPLHPAAGQRHTWITLAQQAQACQTEASQAR